tara:strand:+ start:259 stop:819 length:561 start_codon:yes stop_codon:yes gene_type:complete
MNFNHSFRPVKLKEAQAFIAKHHRHSKPLNRHRFSIGVGHEENGLKGVATVDNCSGAWSNRYDHLEIRRVCTDGTKNLSSFLLGKASLACFAMGAKIVITYTRFEETCSSLLADNWNSDGVTYRKGHTPKVRWFKHPTWEAKGTAWNPTRPWERESAEDRDRKRTQEVVQTLREWQSKLKSNDAEG